ncbi:MAG: 4Fe-4S binding protein [Chloroflexi bacterium]|nr:4Fe-4S binding protein [Chloroflexota bacterium]
MDLERVDSHTVSVPTVKEKHAPSRFWPRLRAITTIAALLLFAMAARSKVELGTYSSVTLGPLRISEPLGVAQVIVATQQVTPVLVFGGLAGVLVIVLFGRAFCAWLCPARWIFNRGPSQARKPWAARPWIQSGIVGSIVGLAWIMRAPVFCVICPAGVICRGAVAAGTGGSILPTIGWLSAVFGAEWLSGRAWCRDLCPLGAALSRLSRLNPFIKVRANPERCRICVACQNACPEGLHLVKDKDFSSCTKCFACQAACPRGAVEIKWF